MLDRRAGVVLQARQRIVDAFGGEERQRPRLAGCSDERSVGDRIVGGGKIRQREMRLQRADVGLGDVGDALLDHEGERNRPRADADMHRHFMMLQDVADLLFVIAAEEVGAGQRRAVGAGLQKHAVGEPRIDMQVRAADGHDQVGVGGVDAVRLAATRRRGKSLADRRDAPVVDLRDPRHRRRGIVERLEIAGVSPGKRVGFRGRAVVHAAPEITLRRRLDGTGTNPRRKEGAAVSIGRDNAQNTLDPPICR